MPFAISDVGGKGVPRAAHQRAVGARRRASWSRSARR